MSQRSGNACKQSGGQGLRGCGAGSLPGPAGPGGPGARAPGVAAAGDRRADRVCRGPRHRSGPADVSRHGRHRGPGQGEDQPPVALRERPHDHEGHGQRRGKDPGRPRGPGRRELRRLRVRQAPFAGRAEAARRVHREGGRELHAGGLPPEGRQRLVRLHAVRDDRRAPRVPLLRRAVLQGAVAADAAHPLGDDGRLEHADRARVVRRGRRARSSASRRPSRCRATWSRSGSGRSSTSTPGRPARRRRRSASSRRAARPRRAATPRRRRGRCSSASRRTSGFRIPTRSSTSSRSRRPSRSRPWRTRA